MSSSRRCFLSTVAASSLASLLPAAPPKRLSGFDPRIRRLLAGMTLDEKLSQMAQPDQMFLKSPG